MQKNAKSEKNFLLPEKVEKLEPDPRQVVLKGFESIMSKGGKRKGNRIRELRLARMMSKAELARKAGLSPITVSRIEEGFPARLETKRKLLEALGLSLADREDVFFEDKEKE
jgi:DNA-binding XRE family transcriptional regulator